MRLGILLGLVGLLGCRPATQMTPTSGATAGGTLIRIPGEHLANRGVPTVYFGVDAGKGVVVESDDLLLARSPAAKQPGPVTVRVEFSSGGDLEAGIFTYRDDGLILQVPRAATSEP